MSNNEYSYDELIDFTDFSYFDIKEGDYSKENVTIGSLISDNNKDNNEDKNSIFTEGEVYDKKYLEKNFSKYNDYEILRVQDNNDKGFYGVALKSPDGDIIVSMRGSSEPIDWEHNFVETPDKYITSQGQYAAAFLEEVLKETEGKVYVVGHSLGGYLAQVATLENYKDIDKIEKVYGLDSLGFPEDVQKKYENIIKDYVGAGKIEVTGMTGVSQIYEQIKGIKLTYLERDDNLGWFEQELFKLHPIPEFRKRYSGENIKEGKLKRVAPALVGSIADYLANKVSLPRDRYTDIKTELDFKITEKTDGLSVNEFLKKYNKNFKWDNGKIVEEIKIRTLKDNPEYLVRGCVLGCSLGSHKRRVDLRKCHGVYLKEGPALHLEDCVVGEEDNIKSFGLCSRRSTSNMTKLEKFLENTSDLYQECTPIILENWLYAHDNTYIVRNGEEITDEEGNYNEEHLLRALTENSFLVCAYGGLIEPVTSGQEYEKGNMEDRLGELDNQEEELVKLDSKGVVSTGPNV